jgi:Uma2 family endonuclease
MSNNTHHQDILRFLAVLFDLFLSSRALGKLLLAGVPMYLGTDKPAREPDLMIVLNDHVSRIQATYLNGSADIAVEVVSPESDEPDHGAKLIEYEAAGVSEYWLIDPIRTQADIYVLDSNQHYRRLSPDADGQLHSVVLPGLSLYPRLLWQDNLPGATEIVLLVEQMGKVTNE